jgi:hypothetical protein
MPDETIALVFVDIEDSTNGWFQDQRGMRDLIEAYIDLVERRLHPPPRIESFTGDGHLLSFPTVDAAATAALRLQHLWEERRASFNRRDWAATHRLRIGIHFGRIVRLDDGRIVGSPINLCARTMAAAHPAEILVSQSALFDFASKSRCYIGAGRYERFKGIHRDPSSLELVYGVEEAGTPVYPLIGLRPPDLTLDEVPDALLADQRLQSIVIRGDMERDLFARCTAPGIGPADALKLARSFVALAPRSSSAQVALAHAQRLTGDEDAAQRSLDRAQKLTKAESEERVDRSHATSLREAAPVVFGTDAARSPRGGSVKSRKKSRRGT